MAIGIPAGTARKKQPRPTCPLRLPGCGTVVSTVNLNLFSVCHGIGWVVLFSYQFDKKEKSSIKIRRTKKTNQMLKVLLAKH